MSSTSFWYAIQTRTALEHQVAAALEAKGFEAWVPTYFAKKRWSDRTKVIPCALFSGYLFCRLDPSRRLPILTTNGVQQILGDSNGPLPIPGHEMDAVRKLVGSKFPYQPHPYLTTGQRVRITDGPMLGVEGILLRMDDHSHVVLSVDMLQRSVVVILDRLSVEPLYRKGDAHGIGLQQENRRSAG
jgi:transcription antitermination factor NusG